MVTTVGPVVNEDDDVDGGGLYQMKVVLVEISETDLGSGIVRHQ